MIFGRNNSAAGGKKKNQEIISRACPGLIGCFRLLKLW